MSTEPRTTNCDVVILGGGMSGLALACHIADRNDRHVEQAKTVWVVEPRANYQQDKTWCFWQQHSTPFDAAITHRWQRWQISSEGQTHTCECPELPYVRVDSGRYYAIAQERLDRCSSVNLLTGIRANTLQVDQAKVTVYCENLQFVADYVYDTRPKDIADDTLLQHFVGWEVETDNDAFDPQTVTLMDFQTTTDGDIHFFYVLPFDKRHALIETTHFSKTLLDDKTYARELTDYLSAQLGVSNWQIQRKERGVIPMPKNAPNPAQREYCNVIPFGLHADTAKPSTGYCYPHAQYQAQHHMRSLFAAEVQVAEARKPLARWLDQVFISFLEHRPDHAADTFLQLFKRVPAQILIRFLSDNARITDYLRVITAMPKLLLIREAIRCVRNK